MRVARFVCDPRRGKRIEGAARLKDGGRASGKAGGGGGTGNGFAECAGGDEGKVHLETERAGGREGGVEGL